MENSSQLDTPTAPFRRTPTFVLEKPAGEPSFSINGQDKSFKHQYANIYFMRLHALRRFVEEKAKRRWTEVAGDPIFVPRVLDVEKGQLSYIVGTVYMDMPLKPNVLDDIARDHSIPAPPAREKYHSEDDNTMLEDESGRIRLVGERLKSVNLVTGVIAGALGIETNNGDFEVVDICLPGMAPQSTSTEADKDEDISMDVDEEDEWLAAVSGLDVGAPSSADGQVQMLAEYLTGEAGGLEEQLGVSRISRLIIAGNSLTSVVIATEETTTDKKSRRYGQETATFSPQPIRNLSAYLTDIARSMPLHLLPGPCDPTGTLLPQQPLPRAMFGDAASFGSFSCETNPTYIHICPSTPSASDSPSPATGKATTSGPRQSPKYERTLLVNSGQPLDDMFRYLPSTSASRLSIAESTLKWRHMAPTAPDTLWCHPYLKSEPFVMKETPDIYIIGNQPAFRTKLAIDDDSDSREGGKKRCRIVLVPKFNESGVVALINLRTLQAKTVRIAVQGMSGGVQAQASLA